MLDRLKELVGLGSVDGYEREVLEREYVRIERKLQRTEKKLGTVHCSTCTKEENPRAKALMSKRRKLEKRQEEIERKIGGVPDQVEARRSRRESKRASA